MTLSYCTRGEGYIVTDDGDVLPPDSDFSEGTGTDKELDDDYPDCALEVARLEDFGTRNRALLAACSLAGDAGSKDGYATHIGEQSIKGGRMRRDAESLRTQAKNLLSSACGACALAPFCGDQKNIASKIGATGETGPGVQSNRKAIREFVKSGSVNLTCEEMLQTPVLRKRKTR